MLPIPQGFGARSIATVFESYIGALHLQRGPQETRRWILDLLSNLPDSLPSQDHNQGLSTEGLQILEREAKNRGLSITWKEAKHTPEPNITWRVTVKGMIFYTLMHSISSCTVGGRVFEGIHTSKHAARRAAILQALDKLRWIDPETRKVLVS